YQVGVMRALAEHGVLDRIKLLSGTSVGALNAVLYSIGDVELAEYIWTTWIDPVGMVGKIERAHTGFGLHMSRETLRAVLKKADITRIKSRTPVYVCAHDVSSRRRRYFRINDLPESDMIEILCASSAIPLIYPPVKIKDTVYIDGNSSAVSPVDNYPVEVLYRKGSRDMLVVALRHDFEGHRITSWLSRFSGVSQDMYAMFPEARFSVIRPSRDIGGMTGVVDFKKDSIWRRMELGYADGCDFFDESIGGDAAEVIAALARRCLPTAEDMEEFIALRRHKLVTAENPTLGGHVYYRDIYETEGMRIQHHCRVPLAGKVFERHYRILGRDDKLRAYYFDPDDFIEDLKTFEREKNHDRA
ncbi:MAG: patatin-like phospholipase family protein, partial [Oscillospiraceae bacterium]|nr:patatin-like phospholipase family protein [Oscillospiraceae bacterium]